MPWPLFIVVFTDAVGIAWMLGYLAGRQDADKALRDEADRARGEADRVWVRWANAERERRELAKRRHLDRAEREWIWRYRGEATGN